jgi:predicted membrane-bound spermidine synthase
MMAWRSLRPPYVQTLVLGGGATELAVRELLRATYQKVVLRVHGKCWI